MTDGFELKYDFVERWGRLSTPENFRIYIYLFMHFKKHGSVLSVKESAAKLHTSSEKINEALEFWDTAGYIKLSQDSYSFSEEDKSETATGRKKTKKAAQKAHLRMRPSYTQEEIDGAATANEKIDFMFKQAETILGRFLSTNDLELLYSFTDWLGLPVEVVIMLLNYAAKLGKTDKRYLETLACDWADKEINTYEAAEDYIKEKEEIHSSERKIRSVLGIYDRALTQTEKKYIKLWTTDKRLSTELISEAYERTVNSTGKLSWAYMNKILSSWAEQGISTLAEIKTSEELFKIKQAPTKKRNTQKSKFNNFGDTNKTDYSKYAEELLNDMLDE